MKQLPDELKALPQWCCSTATDKSPRMPNGQLAESNNPKTWSTYEACLAAIGSHGITRIGFVLTAGDPYTIIDLDLLKDKQGVPLPRDNPDQIRNLKVQGNILQHFDSYTELSSSGIGYHIIIRGKKKPGSKSRKDGVEVYDQLRYMICTGNVVNGNAITDQQDMLNILCDEMGTTSPDIFDIPDGDEEMKDETLLVLCSEAKNGQHFIDLCNGDWEKYPQYAHGKQSSADFALVQWLCEFSPNNQQVERLFFGSGLARRAKAHRRDYFPRTLAAARSRQAQAQLRQDAREVPSATPLCDAPIKVANGNHHPVVQSLSPAMSFPPGLVGEVARYIYDTAYLQAAPIALAGALTFFAGVCGRAYNVNGDGLNLYTVLLADTGRGKEGAADGVTRIVLEVAKTMPGIIGYVGPSHFASGQALHKKLVAQPSFFSFLGEFGHTLEALSGGRANSAEIQLRRMLLQVYGKSGYKKTLSGMEYSDSEKNVVSVRAPALTFMGETTTKKFFDALDPGSISEGLIPRFIIVEHDDKVPAKNPNYEADPDPELIERLRNLALGTLAANQNGTAHYIQVSAGATKIFDQLDEEKRNVLNSSTGLVEKEVWNRVPQNTQRVAGIIAVGVNYANPRITEEEAQWAANFVTHGTEKLLTHFSKGDVGQGNSPQIEKVKSIIDRYYDNDLPPYWQGRPAVVALKAKGWIPREYIMRGVSNATCFTNDRLGTVAALNKILEEFEKQGLLVQIARDSNNRDGFNGQAWVRGRSL